MSRSRNIARLLATNTGSLPRSAMPAGSVLQVQQSVKTNSFSASGSWADIGLNVSITPISTASKILLQASLVFGTGATTVGFRFLRNGAYILLGNESGAIATSQTSSVGNSAWMSILSETYLDSPLTIAEITYGIHLRSHDGRVYFLNRSSDGLSTNGYLDNSIATSTLTAMEIAG